MSGNIWPVVGVGLLIWLSFDLLTGRTWLHRRYSRVSEPCAYWSILLVWFVIALWSLGTV